MPMIVVKMADNEPWICRTGSDQATPYYVIEEGLLKVRVHLEQSQRAFNEKTLEWGEETEVELAVFPVHALKSVLVQDDPAARPPKSLVEPVPASALGRLKTT